MTSLFKVEQSVGHGLQKGIYKIRFYRSDDWGLSWQECDEQELNNWTLQQINNRPSGEPQRSLLAEWPLVYDLIRNGRRPASQEDIDRLEQMEVRYRNALIYAKRIVEESK